MTRPDGDSIVIGVNTLGLGQRPSAWQHEALAPTALVDPEHWVEVARTAERGALDALFLADGPALREPNARPTGFLDPTQTFAAVASGTEHIGLIATASSTFNDPVELARRLLTLDHVSGGRTGWNVVTTASVPVAKNFGFDAALEREERYGRAYEFVELVEKLWDAAATGAVVHHAGERFHYDGTFAGPTSPQGRPVIVQAGGSPGGRKLAGDKADGVFTAEMSFDLALKNYETVKETARQSGRNPADIKILPGFALVLGSTVEEAERRFDEWEERGPANYTFDRLSGILGVDLTAFDLDGPLPDSVTEVPDDPASFTASLSFRQTTVAFARENKLTVRQLLRAYGGYGHPIIIGTPEQVADTFERWFHAEAADGFNIMPDVLPEGLGHFVDHVVPILRDRGIFRHEYEETTLRGHLSSTSRALA